MSDIGIKGLINKNMETFTDVFIKSSLNVKDGIISEKDNDTCIMGLIRDTYMCNLMLGYIGLMLLVSNDVKWKTMDNKLYDFMNEYNSDTKFKKKLILLNSHYEKNKEYNIFLNKMTENFRLHKSCALLKEHIRNLENDIYRQTNKFQTVQIPLKYFNNKYLQELKNNHKIDKDNLIILLNNKNYTYVINIINDINIRHKIEKCYMSFTDTFLNSFTELVLYRGRLASKSGYSTFYNYINRNKIDNSNTINELIKNIVKHITPTVSYELNKIYKHYGSKKITQCDITRFYNIHKNKNEFNLDIVLKVLFNVITQYFNIVFETLDDNIIHKTVKTYIIKDKKTDFLFGKVYIDLYSRPEKKVSNVISMRLSDRMLVTKDVTSFTEMILLANYNTNNVSYDEVILLFKEFGHIIGNMCYVSNVGKLNYDNEFINYVPSIFGFIALDRNIMKQIVKDEHICDHILNDKKISLAFDLKMKCIEVKFDHVIHNTPELSFSHEKNIKHLYVNIYKDFMKEHFNELVDNLDIYIDSNILVSSQGLTYSNLMNEIFAYTSYYMCKDNKSMKFREIVLNDGITEYKELISKFLQLDKINSLNLYINYIMHSQKKELIIEPNIVSNYHDDNEDSDDVDLIINN